ncbi:hypothetical protein Y032_0008g204 [Ancylostoma ceylanicum]|uniref:Uncharacterized protein n=1 Tax=Ancylostoma ceylanicum TaxID=53326 RepID=A0A016VK65_9BILA|nr:hypothetical protein Y032_0008g204 [Ancylostoma ceylanicum]
MAEWVTQWTTIVHYFTGWTAAVSPLLTMAQQSAGGVDYSAFLKRHLKMSNVLNDRHCEHDSIRQQTMRIDDRPSPRTPWISTRIGTYFCSPVGSDSDDYNYSFSRHCPFETFSVNISSTGLKSRKKRKEEELLSEHGPHVVPLARLTSQENGPHRFSRRRYKQILDLLTTLIPRMCSKNHRSDENPVLIGSKYQLLEAGRTRSKLCWLPATAATLGEDDLSYPVEEVNGIHVFERIFAPANWYKPRHGKRVYRPFWGI